ncbi:MAG: leucine-rich repeat domain-containing protein [Lachnospiraceae bacterium]|nr:leucine-rich repeat domain-containing protein [Lachnospiraceae bacterium]
MNLKKLVAALLATAMVMTSSSFVQMANAAELAGDSTAAVQETEGAAVNETLEADADAEAAAGETAETADAEAGGEEAEKPDEAGLSESSEDAGDVIEDAAGEEAVDAVPDSEEVKDGDEEKEAEEAENEGDEFEVRPDDPSEAFSAGGGVLSLDDETKLAESVLLPAGVTTIPAGIFDAGSPAANIVKEIWFLDDELTTIEEGAFKGNTVIEQVGIGKVTDLVIEDDAFNGCTSLSSLSLAGAVEIGKNAFKSAKLRSADLSKAVIIGDNAFNSCGSLNNVTWGKDIITIGNSAFYGCSMQTINLRNLTLLADTDNDPDAYLGDNAFASNNSLTNVTLPKHLTVLPSGIFMNCVKLSAVAFEEVDSEHNLLTSVGSYAFKGCSALKEIEFGQFVNKVDGGAFEDCTELIKITFREPEGNVDINANAVPPRTVPPQKWGVIRGNGSDNPAINKVKKYAEDLAGWKYEPIKLYSLRGHVEEGNKNTCIPRKLYASEGERVYVDVYPDNKYSLTQISIWEHRDKADAVPLKELSLDKGEEDCLYEIESSAHQVFVFTMPAKDIEIHATFMTYNDLFGGGITWDFNPNKWGGANSTILKFDESGDKTKISVYSKKTNQQIGAWSLVFASSDEKVSSVDKYGVITALKKGSATVSLDNRIGNRIAIAVYVKESKKAAEISFEDYFDRVNNEEEDEIYVEDASVLAPDDPDNDTGFYVIEFDVDAIAQKDHKFSPVFDAYAADDAGDPDYDQSLLVYSNWLPSDKSIAVAANDYTGLNTNLITVKKGQYGDCFFEIKIVNDDQTVVRGGFIVRVRDASPRMKKKIVTVNTQQGGGTELKCVPVYGFDIDETAQLTVCFRTTPNGVPTYTPSGDFTAHVERVRYEDEETGDVWYEKIIKLSVKRDDKRFAKGKKTTFSGTSMLYVCGKQRREGQEPVDFHMPINQVVVINEEPAIKLSYVGNINLLYNRDYEYNDTNCVKVYMNIANAPDLTIEDVQLITKENYVANDYSGPVPAGDEFSENFMWDGTCIKNAQGYDLGFVLRVNDTEDHPIDDDTMFEYDYKTGNLVNSGVVMIKLAGYEKTVNSFITVPCSYTFPNYSLSTTRVNTSKYFINPYYYVSVVNNGVSPKRTVELYETDPDDPETPGDPLWTAENDYTGTLGTRPGDFFNDPQVPDDDEEIRKEAKDAKGNKIKDPVTGKQIYNDYMMLSANGYPTNGKERIAFKMNWWRRAKMLDFAMTEVKSKANASATPAQAKLNKQAPEQVARIPLKCSLNDAEFVGIDEVTYKGAAKWAEEAEKIGIDFAEKDDDANLPAAITATLGGDDDIRKGTYAFTAKVLLKFGDNELDVDECPTVRFSVNVTDTPTKIVLKKSTFSLNTRYSGYGELAECPIVVNGLGQGVGYEIDEDALDDIYIEAIAKNYPTNFTGDVVEYDKTTKTYSKVNDGNWRGRFEFGVKEDDNGRNTILTLTLNTHINPGTFSYSYYAYDVPVKTDDGDELLFQRVRFTLQGHDKDVNISVVPKGSFNQIVTDKVFPVSPSIDIKVPGYDMSYTVKISNLNGTLNAVKFAETNIRTGKPYTNDAGKRYSPHFDLGEIDEDTDTFDVTLNRDYIMGDPDDGIEPLADGRAHTIWIYYHIKEFDGKDGAAVEDADAKWETKQVSITPRQTLPQLKQILTNDTLYAGGSAEKRMFTLKLGKTTAQNAVFDEAPDEDATYMEILGDTDVIKIYDKADEKIRRAFRVIDVTQDDPEGDRYWLRDNDGNFVLDANGYKIPAGAVTVFLERPSLLKEGQIYKVPIEIRYKDQAKNTQGTIITIPVMVVK